MCYLSEKFIKLNGKLDYDFTYNLKQDAINNGWHNFPLVQLSTEYELKHFNIEFKKHSSLPISKFNSCKVFRVESGYFEGCYAIVEHDNMHLTTTIHIANENKVLNYYNSNKLMTHEEINSLIQNKKIAEIAAKQIKTFNVSKKRQACQSFFENLPNQCYLSDEFLKDVVQQLNTTPLTIEGAANLDFVNTSACRKHNLNIFKTELNECRAEALAI